MSYHIFVINSGSTSTKSKLAYFEDERKLFETNVFHDAPTLLQFESINDQIGYRREVIMRFLAENNVDLDGIVLGGEEKAKAYTGVPVWNGFCKSASGLS